VSADDLKDELARNLRVDAGLLDADIWSQLIDDETVAHALSVREALDDSGVVGQAWATELDGLTRRYCSCVFLLARKASTPDAAARPGHETELITKDARLDALSQIMALDVARLPQVSELRKDLLQDKLLSEQDVASWLGRRAGDEYKEVGRLHIIARLVQELYGLDESAASELILTGVPPVLTRTHVEIRYRSPYAAFSRIAFDADPRTPPPEVTKLYSKARLRVRGGGDRGMTDKHIALALFAARRMGKFPPVGIRVSYRRGLAASDPHRHGMSIALLDDPLDVPSVPWSEVLQEWNRDHPEWAYATSVPVQHFANDVRVAWERITGCAWRPRQDED